MNTRIVIPRHSLSFLTVIVFMTATAVAHTGNGITFVQPPEPVTGVTVSVHEFEGLGAIEPKPSGTAELKFRGLLLFVDAVDDIALDVDIGLADPDDPFMPLKNFALGEPIGPKDSYGERGDVIFTFHEGVPGIMGFRFSVDGGLSHRYGWVEFGWETLVTEGTVVDQFVVRRAAWMNSPGEPIRAGQLQTTAVPERLVQIRSVDIGNGVIELYNFDVAAQDLSGWQFCTHDENEIRRCTDAAGLNGVEIQANNSLYVHINNDAPSNDPNRINRSNLGPPLAFALPLDTGPYSMQLHFPPVDFGNGATMADHLQWNVLGEPGDVTADRSDEAEAGGVWTNQLKWIVTRSDTDLLQLTDLSGDALHGPGDYEAVGPEPPPDTEMIVFLTGMITSGFDTHGTLGFGAGAELGGRTISGIFVYFPHTAPPDINEAVSIAHHLSMLPESGDWLSGLRMKIDGVSVPRPDFSLVIPPDPSDPSFNEDTSVISLLDDVDPISDGFFYNRVRFVTDGASQFADETLQLGFRDSGTLLHSANIAQPFVLADPSPIQEGNSLASASTVEGFEIIVNDFTLISLAVSLNALRIPGDFDTNGRVEIRDYGFLADCLRGPAIFPSAANACLSVFDFNNDEHLDLADFAQFQQAFGSGA